MQLPGPDAAFLRMTKCQALDSEADGKYPASLRMGPGPGVGQFRDSSCQTVGGTEVCFGNEGRPVTEVSA